MATVRVVVVDEDGNPRRGVTVAAYSLLNFPTILDRKTTDKAGSALFDVSGPVFFDAFDRRGVSLRERNYPGKIQTQIVGFGNAPCYDYVVDAAGFGTHTTLGGPNGAFAAAIAAGGNKAIWVCNNETLTSSLDVTGWNGGGSIKIAAHGARNAHVLNAAKVALTCAVGVDMIIGAVALPTVPLVEFDGLKLVGASGRALVAVTGSNQPLSVKFRGVYFDCANTTVAKNNNHVNALSVGLELEECWGTLQSLSVYSNVNGSGQGGLRFIHDCHGLTFGKLFETQNLFGLWGQPAEIHIWNSTLTFTNSTDLTTDFSWELRIHNARFVYTGSGTMWTGAVKFVSGGGCTIMNAEFDAGSTSGRNFINWTNPGSEGDISIQNVRGYSSVAQSGTLITLSNSFTRTAAMNIFAPRWATAYSGPASGGGGTYIGDHGLLGGLANDDHSQYVLLAGRAGGQTVKGGTAASEALTLQSTAHATKGKIVFGSVSAYDEANDRWGFGTTSPSISDARVQVAGHSAALSQSQLRLYDSDNSNYIGHRANAARTTDIVYEWPATDPTAGQVLTAAAPSGGVSALSWTTPSSGGGGGAAVITFLADPLQIEWTDQPAAVTEFLGATRNRVKIDLTNASTARLVVNVVTAGATGAKLAVQYSTDGSAWNYLDGGTGPSVAVDATGVVASSAVNIVAGAKADVFLRLIGVSGNATADPAFGLIQLQIGDIVSGGGGGGAPISAKYVTTAADGTLTNEVVRQWLGNFYAETYPASANSMDDEFDDSTGMSGVTNGLNARWAWRNQGTSTIDFNTQGWAKITPDSTTGNWRIIEQAAPSGSWTVEAKFSLTGDMGINSYGAIVLIDGTNGDLYSAQYGVFNAGNRGRLEVNQWTNVSTFNSNKASIPMAPMTSFFLRVEYVSGTTTFNFYFSSDGIGWILYHSLVDAVGVTKVGIGIRREQSTGGALYCDYFRRIA
jgi:hypothetical protein